MEYGLNRTVLGCSSVFFVYYTYSLIYCFDKKAYCALCPKMVDKNIGYLYDLNVKSHSIRFCRRRNTKIAINNLERRNVYEKI